MTVGSILDQKGRTVTTIRATDTIEAAVNILAARRIGSLVVTNEDGAISGIISERDVVRAIAEDRSMALGQRVVDHMTAKVVTCLESTSINEVMELMTKGKFRHVPVVASGRLIGIVSIGDVVKRKLDDMEAEHQAMREYIATA